MSAPPFQIIGPPVGTNFGSGNLLYASANLDQERKNYGNLARDTHWLVSDIGRRVQMSLGRKLFADYPALESTILEEANLSVGHFLPIFKGTDKAWGKTARSWLCDEWFPISDFRGPPYDASTFLELHVISELRDGDMGTLLTETSQGYPAFQIIPSHRIRSPLGMVPLTVAVRLEEDRMYIDRKLVDQNRPFSVPRPYEFTAYLFDGAIVGPQGQTIAYRVCNNDFGYNEFTDIAARNMILNFHPKWVDQVRGFSAIGSGGPYWQNVKESRDFALIGQKIADALYAIEHNETGNPNSTTQFLQKKAFGSSGEVDETAIINVKGGIKFFRAGSNSKIEFPAANRPSREAQQFQESVLRDAFQGLEWSYIFGLDPGKAGGASLRVVVDRINRVLDKRRKSPAKTFKRLVGYAIAKAMALKILPFSNDWWRWQFLGPGDVTADKKYDTDVALARIGSGLSNRQIECASLGEQEDEVSAQRAVEVTADIQTAQQEAAKLGITWQEYMAEFRPKQASTPAPPDGGKDNPDNTDPGADPGKGGPADTQDQ